MTSSAQDTAAPTLSDVAARFAVAYSTVGEMVLSVLREAIVTGALRPGERLRQEALAETIGVSRIPVRSALMQLESEGLVTFHPHRGAMVRTLTADRVSEIYQVRNLLEVHALSRSLERMTPERGQRLRDLAAKLDDADRAATFIDDRVAFYRELYDADHNPVLVGLIEQLRSSVGRDLLGLRIHANGHLHRELADLAARGHLSGATKLLATHLQDVCDGLLAVIAESEE